MLRSLLCPVIIIASLFLPWASKVLIIKLFCHGPSSVFITGSSKVFTAGYDTRISHLVSCSSGQRLEDVMFHIYKTKKHCLQLYINHTPKINIILGNGIIITFSFVPRVSWGLTSVSTILGPVVQNRD